MNLKKTLGMFLCLVVACAGAAMGLVINNVSTNRDGVYANWGTAPLHGITISYHDGNIGDRIITASNLQNTNLGASLISPGVDRYANVLRWSGSYGNRSLYAGTSATFEITGLSAGRALGSFGATESWIRIRRAPNINVLHIPGNNASLVEYEGITNEIPIGYRSTISPGVFIPRTEPVMGVAPDNIGGRQFFRFNFPEIGVYHISIRTQLEFPDSNPMIQDIMFVMIVGRAAPRFMADFTDFPATSWGDRNSLTIYSDRMDYNHDIRIGFRQTGGFSNFTDIQGNSISPRINVSTHEGVVVGGFLNFPDFLDAPFHDILNDILVFRRTIGVPIQNGIFNQPRISIWVPAYDDMNSSGARIGHAENIINLTATLTFQDSPTSASFPWLRLVMWIGVLGLLGAGLYALNKIMSFTQVQAIARRRRNEAKRAQEPQDPTLDEIDDEESPKPPRRNKKT